MHSQFTLAFLAFYILPCVLALAAGSKRFFPGRLKLRRGTLLLTAIGVLSVLAGAIFGCAHPLLQFVFAGAMGGVSGIHLALGTLDAHRTGKLRSVLQAGTGAVVLAVLTLLSAVSSAALNPLATITAICFAILSGLLTVGSWLDSPGMAKMV